MGTMITLDVGGISVDWSKNSRGADHGSLFLETDRKRIPSDQIDYNYFSERGEDPDEMELAFVSKLRNLLPRLELLGFTLDKAEASYAAEVASYRSTEFEDAESEPHHVMSFAEFCAFVAAHPISQLDDTFVGGIAEDDEKKIRGRFTSEKIAGLPIHSFTDHDAYSERTYFGSLINLFHPYTVLRVLGTVPENLDLDVVWQYGPLVEAGWADSDDFTPYARRSETFLIATEGSSDVHILRRAFDLLRSDVSH